ncbi:Uncharacterized protein FWK35_00013669 [Aphis craccivora]|uniref:Uncharacterized protein n=1 Tax=Aphis craccivora TaxID=307492 RepID=A0A6G0ZF24_APHCR|nr:Uncharacterized protein FWK35_00013669 [Aphis craccivora]
MSLLYLSSLLLSTLVFQISSEPTELDKITSQVQESLVRLAEVPFLNLEKEDPVRFLRDQIKMFSYKLSSKATEIEKELNKVYHDDSLLTPGMKEIKNKILENLSYLTKSSDIQNQTKDIITVLINKSFNTLPKDMQTKLLSIGQDINTSLKKLRVKYDNENV